MIKVSNKKYLEFIEALKSEKILLNKEIGARQQRSRELHFLQREMEVEWRKQRASQLRKKEKIK